MKKTIWFASSILAATTIVAPVQAVGNFIDLENYDNSTKEAVQDLVNEKIVQGTSATTFSPRTPIKRGQVVKMLGKYLVNTGIAIPQDWETKARFNDIALTTSDRELLKYAAVVYDSGVFVGNNGQLQATGNLTRENVALVLNRLAATVLDDTDLVKYVKEQQLPANVQDIVAVKEEAKEAVLAFNALGISNVSTFSPKGTVQRVHFASFLSKMLQILEDIEASDEGNKPEMPVAPVIPDEPEDTETPVIPDEPEDTETPVIPEEPKEPETPVIPDEPEDTETPMIPDEPETSEDSSEEDFPTYTFDFEDVDNVRLIDVSATSVTIEHMNYGSVKLGVTEELMDLFKETSLLQNAIASLRIEEDVITSINELIVTNSGTSSSPIIIDGSKFEENIPLTIRATYANLINFEDYYESVSIEAPANASYSIGDAIYDKIEGSGVLNITFTESIDDITLDAPFLNVTVANGVTISTLTTTNELSITVPNSAKVEDIYLPDHVSKLTLQGRVENVEAATFGELTINGSGIVDSLYGNATVVYVKANGVVVNYLAVDSEVENVTIK